MTGVAVQLARQMEGLDISWFEEPVCPSLYCTLLYYTILYCLGVSRGRGGLQEAQGRHLHTHRRGGVHLHEVRRVLIYTIQGVVL